MLFLQKIIQYYLWNIYRINNNTNLSSSYIYIFCWLHWFKMYKFVLKFFLMICLKVLFLVWSLVHVTNLWKDALKHPHWLIFPLIWNRFLKYTWYRINYWNRTVNSAEWLTFSGWNNFKMSADHLNAFVQCLFNVQYCWGRTAWPELRASLLSLAKVQSKLIGSYITGCFDHFN